MAEQKHTSGPWFATPTNAPYCHVSSRSVAEDAFGGDIATTWGNGNFAQAKANAHLIAATPELLEALKRCLNFIENTESEMGEPLPCGDLARAAIAKAEAA